MKITRNNTVLDLRPASEVPLTLSNPLFNDTGSFSYPFETPASPGILAALGFPDRPDRFDRYVNKAPATLEHGLLRLSGTHNISAIDRESGTITSDFIADEGAFYDETGNRMLSEVMRTKVVPPDSISPGNNARYFYLWNLLMSSAGYTTGLVDPMAWDYVAFPVCVGTEALDNGGTNYIFLNKTDRNGSIMLGGDGAGNAIVDGITPFLYIRTVIREIMDYYGFTVESNPFVETAELRSAVVLNNTADAFTPGYIDYAALVPTVTVNTFIKCMESCFGCRFFFNYRLRTANIKQLDQIFKADPVKDFTGKMSSRVAMGFTDPQKLVITVGRSFSRSAVIGESLSQVLSETNALRQSIKTEDQRRISADFVRNVVYAANRQNFYITDLVSEHSEWDAFRYKFLCSPFFDYTGYGNLPEYRIENGAEAVNIICARDNSTDYRHIDVPFFEAGVRRHHPAPVKDNIPLVDGYGNKHCPVSFVIVCGWVTANYTFNRTYPDPDIRYLFASSLTAHPIATVARPPGGYHKISLTPAAIRELWYAGFEEFLRRSNIEAACGIDFDAVDINNIRWWEKIWLAGQPYFIDKINLSLTGDSDIRVDSVDLRTARLFGGSSVSYVFNASPTAIKAPAAGGEYWIDIVSTANGDWIEYLPVSKSEAWIWIYYPGNARMKIVVEPNKTGSIRTGTILLRQTDTAMTDIAIYVNQER